MESIETMANVQRQCTSLSFVNIITSYLLGDNMKIWKYQNYFQKIKYLRIYRFPMWFLNKLRFRNIVPSESYTVSMRLGHKIKLRATQNFLKNVLFSRQYHDWDAILVDKFLPKNGVILDIGANIGLYSALYAQYLKHKSPKIYAIEAVKQNFDYLNENISQNGFTNIETFQIALGDKAGELSFYLPDADYVGNLVGSNVLDGDEKSREEKSGFTQKVKMVTLDEWSIDQDLKRCDFMKIDIEGAELLAFKGASEFLAKFRPVIQCEYNKRWLEATGASFSDLLSLFEKLKYKAYIEDGDWYVPIVEKSTNLSLVDLLFVPEEKSIN